MHTHKLWTVIGSYWFEQKLMLNGVISSIEMQFWLRCKIDGYEKMQINKPYDERKLIENKISKNWNALCSKKK